MAGAQIVIAVAIGVITIAVPARAQTGTGQDGDRNFAKVIVDDMKSMVSKESASVLSTATAFALLAAPFDESLTYSASCSTFLKTTFEGWARVMGQEWVLGSAALATYVIGRTAGKPAVAAVGGNLVESQIVAGATTFALKHALRRARPDGEPRSFPSGHAAGTFAAATVIQRHFGLRAAIPAFSAAAVISAARLQANSHYPSDIIMGAAIGVLAGRAATFEMAGRRVSLSPAVAAGGGIVIAGSIH